MNTRAANNRNGSSAKAIAAALLAFSLLLAFGSASALAAEAPPQLWKRGENCGEAFKCDWGVTNGGTDIETQIPRGIATDPTTGHLYIADQSNQRIVEFTAWGIFVKAWGWGVKDGSPVLQTCTPLTDCKAGIQGEGVGQFASPQGMAVDSSGDVYVVDFSNHRVQKFDSEGNFLLMFGGGVNKGPLHPGNVCTATHIAEGDSCGAGTTGAANGQFSAKWPVSSYIATGPADQVYVGDENRIQEFSSSGSYVKSIALLGETVSALAADPSGNLYAAFSSKADVLKLNSAGTTLCTGTVANPNAVAAGAGGNFYVVDDPPGFAGDVNEPRVLEFDSDCKRTEVPPFGQDEFGSFSPTGIATGSACFSEGAGLYVSNSDFLNSFIRAYGTPDKAEVCPPPPVPPTVAASYAISVGAKEATLGAQINPHFWPDATYFMQYGTAACVEAGGWEAACVKEQPAPPAKLNSGAVAAPAATAGVFLSGLEPDTAYRYRFIAQSGGGGPAEGAERSFVTFPLPQAPNTACPNQAFRTGAGAFLPDCRAYEMVSPLDKEGGDIAVRGDVTSVAYPARLDQSALAGDSFTYSSYRAFGGAEGAPYSTQYMARRGAGGWQSEPISPPKEGDNFNSSPGILAATFESPFKVFTADLSQGWVGTYSEPVLAPGGQPGFANLYRRQSADGSYEACTTSEPQVEKAQEAQPMLEGISADGSMGVFVARDALTPDANPPAKAGEFTNLQLYECEEGEVRLASVLPNGTASKVTNNAGTLGRLAGGLAFHEMNAQNAVSADGERVFWTAGDLVGSSAEGQIYVRIGGAETIAVSKAGEALSGSSLSRFWAASQNGSKAIFSVVRGAIGLPDLYEFEVDSETTTPIASEVLGVAGVSEDATRVYFATREDLGGGGVAGEPNLYLYEAGEEGGEPTFTFVAVLSEGDALAHRTPVQADPSSHTAQVSPDGAHLVFMADSPELAEAVAGYDNSDLASSEPDREVYRYAAGSNELACISCDPSGARPVGREVFRDETHRDAARIPVHETSFHAPRALSEDGSRVFFESFGPLVLADTNGKADVYQWEAAGSGDCDEADAAFVKASGGCLSLISSGKSPTDSEIADSSADGSSVFIRTAAGLVSQDPGSVDLYVARINGGFPPPSPPAPECEGTSCQNPPGAPNDPTPASASFRGPGDPSARKPKPRCAKRKAKRAANSRCAKKQHHKRKRADHKRRAGR